jgi:hypothetical protein
MLSPELRDLVTDRVSIKATRKLRRKITPSEISQLLRKYQGKLINTEKQYIKEIDKIINTFLEDLCES